MHASSAFEAIEDPSDPAWHGHAPEPSDDARWGGRTRVVVIAASLLLVVALLVAGALELSRRRSSDDRQPTKIAVDSPTVRPSAVVAADALPAIASEPVAPVPRPRTAPAPTAHATPAPTGGSGWAPAAATVAPEDAGSGLLTGDLTGIHPELIRRLDSLAVAMGTEIEVVSGWRTRHEQEDLYDSFLKGAGNLAAVPGTSKHETGRAADVYIDGVSLADVDGARERAAALGMHFPVPGEAWHVEIIGF